MNIWELAPIFISTVVLYPALAWFLAANLASLVRCRNPLPHNLPFPRPSRWRQMHLFRVSIFSCYFWRFSFFTFRCFHAVKFNHKVQPSNLSLLHGRTLWHFAIIPVDSSPSFSTFQFRWFRPHFSVQTGDPNSDDELRLMGEVQSLQSQLKRKGDTFNEKMENMFLENLTGKPLSDRIRKWTIKRDQLRDMAQHTSSGGPAVSLDVDSTGLKADQHVVKEEEKEQKKRMKRRRIAAM